MKHRYWQWVLAAAMTVATPAMAQSETATAAPASPTQTSASTALQDIIKNTSASYTMWVTGPTVGQIDGNDGPGANLTLNQFLALGYKLNDNWRLTGTQYFINRVRPDGAGKRNLSFMDPYLTLSAGSIAKAEALDFNLSFYARYYLPISHESADSLGTARDQKNGKFRFKLSPSIKLADGMVSIAGTTYFYKPLAGAKPSEGVSAQRDFYIYFYPSISVEVADNFQPYVAYGNAWEHFRHDAGRNGGSRWASFNDKHNIELGFAWQPVKGLNINPYVEYGPTFVPRDGAVGLIAEYAFL